MLTAARRTLKSGKAALVLRPRVRSVSVAAEAADIKARILNEIQKPDTPPVVVLDLSELQYSGTYFFAILLGIRKRLAAQSQSLRLCNVDPEVDQSLRLCMLHRIIPVYATVDEAIEA
ncbi:MAG TPA: STAS domain-containing protein [Candidatus Brocadiia bacterium]|nr:STAS domain-containing protein [Candidatus Brocadiia bacterium]